MVVGVSAAADPRACSDAKDRGAPRCGGSRFSRLQLRSWRASKEQKILDDERGGSESCSDTGCGRSRGVWF